jgi:uncharacterized membrane protein
MAEVEGGRPPPTGISPDLPRSLPNQENLRRDVDRVVMFSDAVFAIAITLLIIDIKFPENLTVNSSFHLYLPTILGFFAFTLSFFFVGRFWAIHLRLFRMLRTYDPGLINRNLLFLFFIVTFPFTASGLKHMWDGVIFPLYLYMFNIGFVTVAHLILCHYIFYGKTKLAKEGNTGEKKYLYVLCQYNAISMMGGALLMLAVSLIFPHRDDYIGYSCGLSGLLVFYGQKRAKKHKPANIPA